MSLAEQSTKPPVLVLRGLRTIEGRVVDRQGRPIAGARIRQSGDGPLPTETLSTDDGHFRLSGILEGPALIFAEKEGCRFAFVGCSASTSEATTMSISVVLARTSELPAVAYHTLPPALPVEEEKALARRLIQPCVERFLQHGTELEKLRLLQGTAEIDPLGMLDRLESFKIANPDYVQILRINLAEALSRENLDDATELLEASNTADIRAWGYAGICELRRDLPPARIRDFLAQATVNARGMKSATDRMWLDAQIAERWLDLGETERARALIDEALAIGRNSPKGNRDGYNLGLVAEALARLDLPAALKVVDDLQRDARQNDKSDRSILFERVVGAISYRLAAQSPADAERVLERIPIKQSADWNVAAVCSRMAAKDLARARRIAETRISREAPERRAHVLGLMAQAIAANDKTTATQLIDEAYAALDRIAAKGGTTVTSTTEVAAGLLPIVEQIEPERLADVLARALAMRPAQGDATGRQGNATAWNTTTLAMMIARYDRALAAQLLEPELKKTGSHMLAFGTDNTTFRVLSALAMIDPKRAVALVEALPDDPAPGTDPMASEYQARIYVAKALAFHGADRWRYIYQYFLGLWTPDQRYL